MLKVLKSGFYSSVQDTGRFNYRRYGVPVSGAMDSYSSQLANSLLGNSKDAALIEITMTGPVFQFFEPTVIIILGADISPVLNNEPVKMNSVLAIQNNDILSFGKLKSGLRAYLAVKDGFLTDRILGSRSMYQGITPTSRINNNDVLVYKSFVGIKNKLNANVKYDNEIINSQILEVCKGPEFNRLTEVFQKELLSNSFRVSRFNSRMACQLESSLENELEQILTSPVLPGTVQLTPNGKLIILLRDCQVTGGYPRVLQLTEKSINILSQKTIGSSLKIRLKD